MAVVWTLLAGMTMAAKPRTRKRPNQFRWREFLAQFSRDLLGDQAIREMLPKNVVSSEWLGYKGASESQIAALEKRIDKALPPSYRSFLAETDGWRNCGAFIYNMLPCSEVRWFRERNQQWIDAYVFPEKSFVGADGKPPPPQRALTDKEYLKYGSKQDSCHIRPEYLQWALEISDVGDSAILLLNPLTVTEAGEWEAWFFANWAAGADRYRSFRDLMQGEHKSFLKLLRSREES
jgi:hypothetical protein